MLLGLEYVIWVILALYFAGMLILGWWSRRRAASQEGYLLGNRRFGVFMMIMHAFGAGTNPGDAAGVVSKTAATGASGIWVSWMWMFGTPFYWLIAPVIRRLRCLTMADFFQMRFSRGASVLYIFVASTGMAVCLASVMLATTRTVQGMMGKPGDAWFFGILLVTTVTFMLYGYWGGIVAAIRTDMVQGIMIILLSFLAIPAAFRLEAVGGFEGMAATLRSSDPSLLRLFDPASFRISTVLLLCINAPLTALALPHLVSVCGAGKSEWEGRMGFTCGNMLKRICTIGWSLLALAWLAHLLNSGLTISPETAFGDAIRALLSPPLQGLMLACVMAAAMSSGDAFQVTVAGLFSQNVYKEFIKPDATDMQVLRVTRVVGLFIVLASLAIAVMMRESMVRAILDYFNILGLVGISIAMGIVWRRMNSAGMFACTGAAVAAFIICRYGTDLGRNFVVGVPLLAGSVFGVLGSLLTAPPEKGKNDAFFRMIHTPIGQEERLDLPLAEAVPESNRLITAGGLFIMKPSRQSWLGFVLFFAACVVCVLFMLMLLGYRTPAVAAAAALPFFPVDNAFNRSEGEDEQAALLAELGYDGICSRPANASEDLFAALDKHDLDLLATYVVLPTRGPGAFEIPEDVATHIRRLKGRGTIVWLTFTKGEGVIDDQLLPVILEASDLARDNGLTVALYPHVGFYIDTVKTARRLVEKINRPDVGLSFNLCHFLRQNDHVGLEATLLAAAPYLKLVQINGADQQRSTDWSDLIKPLDEGDHDLHRVLNTLDDIGFSGPVCLQCYNITLPAREHLARSMMVWKSLRQ